MTMIDAKGLTCIAYLQTYGADMVLMCSPFFIFLNGDTVSMFQPDLSSCLKGTRTVKVT